MELISKISNHFKKKTKLAVVSGSEEITFKELDIKVNLKHHCLLFLKTPVVLH